MSSDILAVSWAAPACQRAHRNLSQAEWQTYMGKDVPYHCTTCWVRWLAASANPVVGVVSLTMAALLGYS